MAGFLGFGDFTKAGKGISKNSPKKKGFFLFFDILSLNFWTGIKLDLIYFLAALPTAALVWLYFASPSIVGIVLIILCFSLTLGPVTAGITYIVRNCVKGAPFFLISDLIEHTGKNYLLSLLTSMVFLATSAVSAWSVWFYFDRLSDNLMFAIPLSIALMVFVSTLFASFHVFIIVVTFDLKFHAILKNGFIFAVLNFKNNLLSLLFIALVLAGAVCAPNYLILLPYAFILPSFITFIAVFNSYGAIHKYMISPSETDDDSGGGDAIFNDRV